MTRAAQLERWRAELAEANRALSAARATLELAAVAWREYEARPQGGLR